jgi:hypothetical protein
MWLSAKVTLKSQNRVRYCGHSKMRARAGYARCSGDTKDVSLEVTLLDLVKIQELR